jgi:hypothetical protein
MTKVVLMLIYFWTSGDALMFDDKYDTATACDEALPAGREAALAQFPTETEPEDYVVYCVDASPPPRKAE